MTGYSFFSTLGAFLIFLIHLAVMARVILRPHREPASRIAWIVIIIVLPVAGMVAYLFLGETNIGRRRVRRIREVLADLPNTADAPGFDAALQPQIPESYAHLFRVGRSVNGFEPLGGNRGRLLANSNSSIESLVTDIDSAGDHVHVIFYIWLPDNNGLKVVEALKRAASRGVTCRVMADGLGSRIMIDSKHWKAMRDAQVRVATALPIGNLLLRSLKGRIDLRKNLRGDYRLMSVQMTSPGIIYKDLIMVGGRNPESHPSPPGDIRAFDVHTGAERWRFHTIPHPGEFGYETWPKDAWTYSGAANNWAGMSLDEKRGIVYVPTGSPTFDFYGADRVGNNLFADTLLALDANTGKRIWHFQDVHHDIWDRDFPAPPALVSVKRNGKQIDAVAQTTKQGYLFLFDRVTGKPLFPIKERPFPSSQIPAKSPLPRSLCQLLPRRSHARC